MSDDRNVQNANQPAGKPFTAMTFGGKLNFIGKALVFFVSGGFIFPTLWVD